MSGDCARCAHADHVGACGVFVVKHGIEDMCTCVIATAASLERHELRTRDYIQRADIKLAQQDEWDKLPPEQQRKLKRRVQWRKMK